MGRTHPDPRADPPTQVLDHGDAPMVRIPIVEDSAAEGAARQAAGRPVGSARPRLIRRLLVLLSPARRRVDAEVRSP
jgi:hypothetical protein